MTPSNRYTWGFLGGTPGEKTWCYTDTHIDVFTLSRRRKRQGKLPIFRAGFPSLAFPPRATQLAESYFEASRTWCGSTETAIDHSSTYLGYMETSESLLEGIHGPQIMSSKLLTFFAPHHHLFHDPLPTMT